ncbi:F-box/RNI-like superfamily protein [Rhynchospora pubera]|uniref:F-box/RNI-like superfamily protein n=1 Tax=Rhynchospora pubera TaxID=906938 RepID=A0AAV8GU65_9POAL|nr:F-box/RNI-like superfamily protein [Rhynchospora pubera]KAJ4809203.1 F-box/RNI-like superfamily protein [Rhynchospora pubera]
MEHPAISTDWISQLPEAVLTDIMSLISTKEAVSTCVLSKSWEKLWASVPVLHFDLRQFLGDHVDSWEKFRDGQIKFVRFVNSVLRNRRNSKLDTFSLKMERQNGCYCALDISPWIIYAIGCKPRVLSLVVSTYEHLYIPNPVFTCTSLEELHLVTETRCTELIETESVELPSLKSFSLGHAMIDGDFMKQLLSGCPILEKVVLYFCDLHMFSDDRISSNSLQHFIFSDCGLLIESDVEVFVPSLVHLGIRNCRGDELNLHAPSLVHACIYHSSPCFYKSNLFGGLTNATSLDLFGTPKFIVFGATKFMDEQGGDLANFPLFNNLKNLSVGEWCMISNFNLVASFLQNSPNLENLTLYHKPSPNATAEDMAQWLSGILFQHENLKKVHIVPNMGTYDQSFYKLVNVLRASIKDGAVITVQLSFANMTSSIII